MKRRDVIATLRRLGWAGPFAGGKHGFMTYGSLSLVAVTLLVLSLSGFLRPGEPTLPLGSYGYPLSFP